MKYAAGIAILVLIACLITNRCQNAAKSQPQLGTLEPGIGSEWVFRTGAGSETFPSESAALRTLKDRGWLWSGDIEEGDANPRGYRLDKPK